MDYILQFTMLLLRINELNIIQNNFFSVLVNCFDEKGNVLIVNLHIYMYIPNKYIFTKIIHHSK